MNKRYFKIILLILLGALLGVASSLADKLPTGSPFFVVGGFLNTASVWSISAFIVGSRFRSRINSVAMPIIFLAFSVSAYYITGFALNTIVDVPVITIVATYISWVFIAILVGALCGLAGMSAKYSRDIKKRMIAIVIPMVIILIESVISVIQLLPYLSANNNNYIPFGVLTALALIALSIPFFIYNNKRIAFYNMVLGLLLSIVGALILMALSTV